MACGTEEVLEWQRRARCAGEEEMRRVVVRGERYKVPKLKR